MHSNKVCVGKVFLQVKHALKNAWLMWRTLTCRAPQFCVCLASKFAKSANKEIFYFETFITPTQCGYKIFQNSMMISNTLKKNPKKFHTKKLQGERFLHTVIKSKKLYFSIPFYLLTFLQELSQIPNQHLFLLYLFGSTWSFFIGLHSRTEIGEREITGSTVQCT